MKREAVPCEGEETEWLARFSELCRRLLHPEWQSDLAKVVQWVFDQNAGADQDRRLAKMRELSEYLENLARLLNEVEELNHILQEMRRKVEAIVSSTISALGSLSHRLSGWDLNSNITADISAALHTDPKPVLGRFQELIRRRDELFERRSKYEAEIGRCIREFTEICREET